MKSYLKSFLLFILTNLILFTAHHFLAKNINHTVNIPLSYGLNAIAAFSICIVVYSLNDLFKSQIGFIFLGLSFVKMILLYYILNPKSGADSVSIYDALIIFIPFFANLIMEQLFMIRVLKLGDVINSLRKD